MGKVKKQVRGDAVTKPYALTDQLTSVGVVKKVKTKNSRRDDDDHEKDEIVDDTLSRKIIKEAKKQLDELEDDHEIRETQVSSKKKISLKTSKKIGDDDDHSSDADSIDFDMDHHDNAPEIDEEEERALRKFMLQSKVSDNANSGGVGGGRLLSDIIMEKIEEKRFELESTMSQSNLSFRKNNKNDPYNTNGLDPKLVELFRDVGKVLSTYRSGKLPKAFKIIPKLTNWEQVLFLTSPEKWTAASVYQATRIFVSNLNGRMCQRFLSLILFPRIRDDITEFKKLNFHLYQALAKALFKPAAFFKAILLPLCESGDCTLREATIIGSLLTKCSVPSLHSAAAMLKIAEMNYSGANSLFLRILIDKKYTLPFRVIDGLVEHFLKFSTDDRQLPVLWHQSLLAFVQRYKADLSTEQKEHLMELIKTHYHHQISPEVRWELSTAQSRDVEDQEPIVGDQDELEYSDEQFDDDD
uniref:Bystin n=1 Tax=Romanomermis culicivorax TaxID=13658 RepID=A0A915HMX0_ROMCU